MYFAQMPCLAKLEAPPADFILRAIKLYLFFNLNWLFVIVK